MGVTKEVPWFRVFVEGTVIVGSILLAFGIDAAWADRQERSEEQLLLNSLADEFEDARAQLASGLEDHHWVRQAATGLMELGEGEALPTDSIATAAYLVYHTVFSTHVVTGTLDGAAASAKLGLVTNRNLRGNLAAWPSVYGEFSEQQVALRDFVEDAARPVAIGESPVAEGALALAAALTSSGFHMDLGFGDDRPWVPSERRMQELLDFVRSDVGQDLAATRFMLEYYAIRDGEGLLAYVDELLSLIDSELER